MKFFVELMCWISRFPGLKPPTTTNNQRIICFLLIDCCHGNKSFSLLGNEYGIFELCSCIHIVAHISELADYVHNKNQTKGNAAQVSKLYVNLWTFLFYLFLRLKWEACLPEWRKMEKASSNVFLRICSSLRMIGMTLMTLW